MDFMHYWQYTDAITKVLFFILFALSLSSWVVGILRILQSKKLANVVADGLTEQLNALQPQLMGLSADSKKAVIEQTLLQQISRYRFDSEKGLSVLGLAQFGEFFMPCIALVKVVKQDLGKWQDLLVKH